MLEFVRNMKIFGSEDLLWLLSYWCRDFLPGNVRLIFGMSMVVIQTLITNFTLLYTLKGLITKCGIWLVSSYCESSRAPHVCGGRKRTLRSSFRNAWFHLLWGVHDFTYSLYILHRMCQYWDYVYGLMTQVCLPGLVWLLCLRTYFIHELVRKFAMCMQLQLF